MDTQVSGRGRVGQVVKNCRNSNNMACDPSAARGQHFEKLQWSEITGAA